MTGALLSVMFVGAALAALAVIIRSLSAIPGQVRAICAATAACADMREVRFTFRTLDVVPEGGTVVRGQFSAERRRPRPQSDLPAAA